MTTSDILTSDITTSDILTASQDILLDFHNRYDFPISYCEMFPLYHAILGVFQRRYRIVMRVVPPLYNVILTYLLENLTICI